MGVVMCGRPFDARVIPRPPSLPKLTPFEQAAYTPEAYDPASDCGLGTPVWSYNFVEARTHG